jgi:dipeptidyl aminopeptidase/acylaminoacyl peptidase
MLLDAAALTLLLVGSPQVPTEVAVPPGARRVISADKHGSLVAMCAEVTRPEATLMQRNGRKLPPTHIFIDDGTTVRKVVTGLGGCSPAWSPDGNWLAFTAPDGLWAIARPDDIGHRLVDITRDAGSRYATLSDPRWSPDSGRIAYLRHDRGRRHIEVVDVSTGQLLLTERVTGSQFAWSDASTVNIDGRALTIR